MEVFNKTLTSADTEYDQELGTDYWGLEFQCRTEAEIRFAFVTGKVATPTAPYMTLKAGDYAVFINPYRRAMPSVIYLASSTAGVVVEIITRG